jgi:hypothetical protein
MTRRSRLSRTLCVVLALAAALRAPRGALHAQEVAYAVNLPDLDSATQVVISREITRARERGLPLDPLIAKVREGRLKRAPGVRIRAAVERLGERLGAAREALGAASTPEEVTAGADAIAAGAQPSSLRAVRAATAHSVTAPVGALAQLLASGVTEGKAMEIVLSLLRRNASAAVLIALGNQVEADVWRAGSTLRHRLKLGPVSRIWEAPSTTARGVLRGGSRSAGRGPRRCCPPDCGRGASAAPRPIDAGNRTRCYHCPIHGRRRFGCGSTAATLGDRCATLAVRECRDRRDGNEFGGARLCGSDGGCTHARWRIAT